MQNVKTREFLSTLKANGYEPVRQKGSHTIFQKVVTHTLSVPTSDKTINGALCSKLMKQMV